MCAGLVNLCGQSEQDECEQEIAGGVSESLRGIALEQPLRDM